MDHVSVAEARQAAAIAREREGIVSALQSIEDAQFVIWHAYTWPDEDNDTRGEERQHG